MLYCHYDYDWHFLGGIFQILKLFCHFPLHRTLTSGYPMYDCSNFVHSCQIFGIHISALSSLH
jgi:hypothetical protein